MKLGKVRIGERFVFDTIGGVYAKVSHDKARCIYGSKFGNIESFSPDWSVYVIFDQHPQENKDETKSVADEFVTESVPECPTSESKPEEVITISASEQEAPVVVSEAPMIDNNNLLTFDITKPSVLDIKKPVCDNISEGRGIVKLVVIDEEERVIAEIDNPTASQVSAYSTADGLKMNDKKGRHIHEVLVDHVNQVVYVVVGEELM